MHPSSEISMHPSSDISAPPLTLSHLDQDLTTTHRPRIPSFDHSTSCIEARYAHMPTQGNKWRTCQRKITNAHQGICRLNRNCHTSAITTLSTLTLRCFSNSLCRSHVLALKTNLTHRTFKTLQLRTTAHTKRVLKTVTIPSQHYRTVSASQFSPFSSPFAGAPQHFLTYQKQASARTDLLLRIFMNKYCETLLRWHPLTKKIISSPTNKRFRTTSFTISSSVGIASSSSFEFLQHAQFPKLALSYGTHSLRGQTSIRVIANSQPTTTQH